MSDLISRQVAIDAMCELMHHWFGGDPKDEIREIKRELENLPSAQPDASDCVLELYGECSYAETGCSDCKIKNEIHNAFVKAAQYDWMIRSIIKHGDIRYER